MDLDEVSAADLAAASDLRRRLWIVVVINLAVVVAQAVGAWLTGSLALLTDTFDAAIDATTLLVALVAATLMFRPATARRTWGYRRIEVVAALLQAAVMVVVGVVVAIEAVRRLDHVEDVHELHASTVATGLVRLSAHVVVRDECFTDGHAQEILNAVRARVERECEGTVRSAIQLEASESAHHDAG